MVATRKWTVEEIAANPPEGRWELVEGELLPMAPSGAESSTVGARITVLVGGHVLRHRLGHVFNAEGGFRPDPSSETVRSPDFAFVRSDRFPGGAKPSGFPALAPDFAVEVLSPTDRRTDAVAKCNWWIEVGARLVWLVDPERQAVLAFTADDLPHRFVAGDHLDGGDVLPGLSIPVADIFA